MESIPGSSYIWSWLWDRQNVLVFVLDPEKSIKIIFRLPFCISFSLLLPTTWRTRSKTPLDCLGGGIVKVIEPTCGSICQSRRLCFNLLHWIPLWMTLVTPGQASYSATAATFSVLFYPSFGKENVLVISVFTELMTKGTKSTEGLS